MKPIIEIEGKVYEMATTPQAADLIMGFSDRRRMLPVEEFFEKHSEILAKVFNAPIQAIAKLSAIEQVQIYLDCLEHTARQLSSVSSGKVNNRRKGEVNEV